MLRTRVKRERNGSNVAFAMKPSDDYMLIEEARRGNWRALREFTGKYDGAILRLTMRVAGSEDGAQKLFETAFRDFISELKSDEPATDPRNWILRKAAQVCMEHLRARRRDGGCSGNPIRCALARLSPRERMIFELKHYERERLQTIAEILGMDEEAARQALVRAAGKLRRALQGGEVTHEEDFGSRR